ncbi:MAG: hypothetical protein BWY63_01640 [Chloroflexi bacterium ADurb.Bin360]|nr:MAG: hypothetical protein BWY63_01640 [Chloroflexi bacterium ADurb.Bin360]
MRQVVIVCLRDLQLVSHPALPALFAVARLGVVRTLDARGPVVRTRFAEDDLPRAHLVLLGPDRAQGLDLGQRRQRRGRRRGRQPVQQPLPIGADGGLQLGLLLVTQPLGHATRSIAFFPGRRDGRPRPGGVGGQQGPHGQPQRLDHQFEPVQLPYFGQHRGAVRALAAPPFEQAQVLQLAQHRLKNPRLGLVLAYPIPKLAQHAEIEPGVVQGQMQGVLPVQAQPHRLGGLAIRLVLQRLEDRHQRQIHGRQGRLPLGRIQIRIVGLVVLVVELVAHQTIGTGGR